MLKILLAIAVGLVGAALLHLVIVLSLPYFSDRDAYSRVLSEGEAFTFHILDQKPDAAGLAQEDPFLETAVCSFDTEEHPARLTAGAGIPFWSLAIYDPASNETFSINDRTSSGGKLDVIIATPLQATALRKAMPEGLNQSILVETAQAQGYAVLRAMAPQPSYRPLAAAFLSSAGCQPAE
ncbi:DUF1254 domain-containing protein [Rhizobiales bacterium RZME27]|uniref:DUF1254 domain-containing protein n=1 Tax=Endobacterium cereale TaxID=2663029 RepID=A0A6A8AFD3_9HYPH|nr:DUF1254 domain-containing protein [Endobacterium cereale]MEB2842931.1 DUF1254 domain-containing protein [Endobacterium cereale]MQY49812.1 DUF1254 domain-containing protein [Endobacterium cereale]